MKKPEYTALHAYSRGEIGWRDACRKLALQNRDELHAVLESSGLPPPPEDTSPLDDATKKRMKTFLRGGNAS